MVSKASNERFGAICAEQISLARTYAGAVLQQDRAEAYNMFEGNRLGNEQVGRSQIVSMDLSDIIDATVAQLQPGFAGDNLAEFEQVAKTMPSSARPSRQQSTLYLSRITKASTSFRA